MTMRTNARSHPARDILTWLPFMSSLKERGRVKGGFALVVAAFGRA